MTLTVFRVAPAMWASPPPLSAAASTSIRVRRRSAFRAGARSADAWAPSAHLVHVSIVGCFENPYPYYRAKADAENVVEAVADEATPAQVENAEAVAEAVDDESTAATAPDAEAAGADVDGEKK